MGYNIVGTYKSDMLEWPGKLCTVLFVAGCDYQCPMCHAPALVRDATEDDMVPLDALFRVEFAEGQSSWVDGVVLTGGEPTLNEAGLLDTLGRLRSVYRGPVRMATNGSRPAVLEKLLQNHLVDSIVMDVKTSFEPVEGLPDYGAVIGHAPGFSIEDVRASFKLLGAASIETVFRTTLVYHPKGTHNLHTPEVVRRIISDVQSVNRPWWPLAFKPGQCLDPCMNEQPPTTDDFVADCLYLTRNKVVVYGRIDILN